MNCLNTGVDDGSRRKNARRKNTPISRNLGLNGTAADRAGRNIHGHEDFSVRGDRKTISGGIVPAVGGSGGHNPNQGCLRGRKLPGRHLVPNPNIGNVGVGNSVPKICKSDIVEGIRTRNRDSKANDGVLNGVRGDIAVRLVDKRHTADTLALRQGSKEKKNQKINRLQPTLKTFHGSGRLWSQIRQKYIEKNVDRQN